MHEMPTLCKVNALLNIYVLWDEKERRQDEGDDGDGYDSDPIPH